MAELVGNLLVGQSGGPTAVSDFTVTLDRNGSATVFIPPKGTNSPLAAGTYDVTVTRNSNGQVNDFPNVMVGMPHG